MTRQPRIQNPNTWEENPAKKKKKLHSTTAVLILAGKNIQAREENISSIQKGVLCEGNVHVCKGSTKWRDRRHPEGAPLVKSIVWQK